MTLTTAHWSQNRGFAGRTVVAITGAGISAASGLPTISGGFQGRSLKDLFKLDNARRHVNEYRQLYEEMMFLWLQARPNAAHMALASRGIRVITQNVDGLHKKAGTREVIELHGTLAHQRCIACGRRGASLHTVKSETGSFSVGRCGACGSDLIPDLVLEGEPVRHLALALNWVTTAQIVIIAGTALEMHPVNQLPLVALRAHKPVITINENAEKELPRRLSRQLRSISSLSFQ
ncbi:MAG: iron dicitrate transport regulator FecR [Firmicutes bacterium]|nr:iron dicitrate transport regulator FecR [Bacillota bacterium]